MRTEPGTSQFPSSLDNLHQVFSDHKSEDEEDCLLAELERDVCAIECWAVMFSTAARDVRGRLGALKARRNAKRG